MSVDIVDFPRNKYLDRAFDYRPELTGVFNGVPWSVAHLYDMADKSGWTYDHSSRVLFIAAETGRDLGLPLTDCLLVGRSGLEHDIGKTGLPPEILDKPAKLTEEEQRVMKTHVELGAMVLDDEDPGAAEIMKTHHQFQHHPYPECFPKSDEPGLLLLQELLALADGVDAALSRRPYKAPLSRSETRRYLRKHFDPKKVELGIEAYFKIMGNDYFTQ